MEENQLGRGTIRREIDGLRALAVLPVILFHAGFETFSGGFVGVDVFFVISGYLITTIILAELEQGKFSIVNFYERRARRILPALFLVMLVCIPFAWLWLLPSDLKDFSQSLVAVSVFASNLLFSRESGYFDTAAELKPLLHTWSLAVEGQFYVLFPLFLMLFWKLGKRWILGVLIISFVISLVIAQWQVKLYPSSAFYFLSTRWWELLIGSLAAFYLFYYSKITFNKNVNEFSGIIGILLILYAIFFFNNQTSFPSFYTLVPTMGTVLIILFATPITFTGRILGSKLFVGIGLVSYSAYLWHYPIFYFAKHWGVNYSNSVFFWGGIIIALLFAFMCWKYVENPFRDKTKISRRKFWGLIVVGGVIFIIIGRIGDFSKGFENYFLNNRITPQQKVVYEKYLAASKQNILFYKDRSYYDNGRCRFNVENLTNLVAQRLLDCHKKYGQGVVIFGDSHAIDLYGSISAISKNDFLFGIAKTRCHLPDFFSAMSLCRIS